jgi:hypothetical protein
MFLTSACDRKEKINRRSAIGRKPPCAITLGNSLLLSAKQSLKWWLWQNTPMIIEGTHPFIRIDLGKNELGMTLQRLERREWMKSLFGREQLPKLYDAYFNK